MKILLDKIMHDKNLSTRQVSMQLEYQNQRLTALQMVKYRRQLTRWNCLTRA